MSTGPCRHHRSALFYVAYVIIMIIIYMDTFGHAMNLFSLSLGNYANARNDGFGQNQMEYTYLRLGNSNYIKPNDSHT